MKTKRPTEAADHSCLSCGETMASHRENYRYIESGLPNIILVNVEVRRCAACGEFELVIPKLAQLHRLVTGILAKKPERLTNHEVRYLRKHIGWSGVDFARNFGVTPETVSRWESGVQSINPMAERLLRILTLSHEPILDYSILERVGSEAPKKGRQIRLALQKDWALAA